MSMIDDGEHYNRYSEIRHGSLVVDDARRNVVQSDLVLRNTGGQTMLHLATIENDEDTVRKLVAAGADVNATDSDGLTPLHCACAFNADGRIVALLVKHGADPHARAAGGTVPLHEAARHGHPKVVAYLLDQGVDVNASTKDSHESALQLAINVGDLETVQMLLRSNASLCLADSGGGSPSTTLP